MGWFSASLRWQVLQGMDIMGAEGSILWQETQSSGGR
jgi:hypothetical protein